MPAAPPQPYVQPRPGVPVGSTTLHRLHSTILDTEWRVWIYTPAGNAASGPPPDLLLLFDGWFYTALIPTATILDNLIEEGRIRSVVAVMIDSPTDRARNLNGYPPFNRFLVDELLPWLRKSVRVTTDPRRAVVGGVSLGGVAAAFAALSHPDVFGNVLAQSGAFWKGREGEREEEWLAREIARREPVPVRFHLAAGRFEDPRDAPNTTVLRANRHLRTVLQAKGYDVDYVEFSGGHRVIIWQGILAQGLIDSMKPVAPRPGARRE